MACRALRARPEKKEVRLETKEEDEGREAEARSEDDRIEKARRAVVKTPRTPLATQATPLDNDDVITRAVEVTCLLATAAISFLRSS